MEKAKNIVVEVDNLTKTYFMPGGMSQPVLKGISHEPVLVFPHGFKDSKCQEPAIKVSFDRNKVSEGGHESLKYRRCG